MLKPADIIEHLEGIVSHYKAESISLDQIAAEINSLQERIKDQTSIGLHRSKREEIP